MQGCGRALLVMALNLTPPTTIIVIIMLLSLQQPLLSSSSSVDSRLRSLSVSSTIIAMQLPHHQSRTANESRMEILSYHVWAIEDRQRHECGEEDDMVLSFKTPASRVKGISTNGSGLYITCHTQQQPLTTSHVPHLSNPQQSMRTSWCTPHYYIHPGIGF